MLPNKQSSDTEFFDATVAPDVDTTKSNSIETEIAEAKLRADHQNMIAMHLVDDIIAQKKKSFRRTVVLSVGSVVILLILAIVFFVYLHWYGAGAGVALLALGASQLWLNYFKKWDKSNPDFDEILEADDSDVRQEIELSAETSPTQQQRNDESMEWTEDKQTNSDGQTTETLDNQLPKQNKTSKKENTPTAPNEQQE